MIDLTMDGLIRLNKMDTNLSKNDQRIAAIRVLLQNFARQDLKIPTAEWTQIKIEKIVEDELKQCDIIYVTFGTIEDVMRVNSKFKNLNDKARNKIFQYVPTTIKKGLQHLRQQHLE